MRDIDRIPKLLYNVDLIAVHDLSCDLPVSVDMVGHTIGDDLAIVLNR